MTAAKYPRLIACEFGDDLLCPECARIAKESGFKCSGTYVPNQIGTACAQCGRNSWDTVPRRPGAGAMTVYRHPDIRGCAVYIHGPELERRFADPELDCPDDDCPHDSEACYLFDFDGEEVPTGRVLVVMVGDDREIPVNPDELVPVKEEDYCTGCGQIGCGWGAA